jgi:hypothetical protein
VFISSVPSGSDAALISGSSTTKKRNSMGRFVPFAPAGIDESPREETYCFCQSSLEIRTFCGFVDEKSL